jgi:hypothetical protein
MDVELTIRFEWVKVGPVRVDLLGKLKFPFVPSNAGLYRFEIEDQRGTKEYIGETDLLDRRFQHYRTPGPTQSTNIRLNLLMLETLKANGSVIVSIITDGAKIAIDGRASRARMQNKSERVLLEHAAIYIAREAGKTLINL